VKWTSDLLHYLHLNISRGIKLKNKNKTKCYKTLSLYDNQILLSITCNSFKILICAWFKFSKFSFADERLKVKTDCTEPCIRWAKMYTGQMSLPVINCNMFFKLYSNKMYSLSIPKKHLPYLKNHCYQKVMFTLILFAFMPLSWPFIPGHVHKEGQHHMSSGHCNNGSTKVTIPIRQPKGIK
jgi:hypothetical protein